MKKRIVGIDLTRIIAMVMIMNYHILMYGSWMTSKSTNLDNRVFGQYAIALTVISVNLFAIISGYVGLNSHHHINRFLELWSQVIFYSWIVLAWFYYFKPNVLNEQLVIHNLFPTLFKGYWYWNGYIILFVLMPVINKGLKAISHKTFTLLIVVLFLLTSLMTLNPDYDIFNLGLGYSGLWLIVLYIYGAYIKKFGVPKLLNNNYFNFFLIVVNLILVVWISNLFHQFNIWINNNKFDPTQFQYTFPLIVTLAIFVFTFLLKVDIKSKFGNKIIVFLGKKSFSAYLLQTNPLIFTFLITNNYNYLRCLSLNKMVETLFLIALSWYFGAIIIDVVRSLVWKILHIDNLFNYIDVKWKGTKKSAD